MTEEGVMPAYHKIDYVEFSACDIPASKAFFSRVFGWTFEDFGSEYTPFANAGIEGGFLPIMPIAALNMEAP